MSARRKRLPEVVTLKPYTFLTNRKEVTFMAEDLNEARIQFQERYGYWPEKEVIND